MGIALALALPLAFDCVGVRGARSFTFAALAFLKVLSRVTLRFFLPFADGTAVDEEGAMSCDESDDGGEQASKQARAMSRKAGEREFREWAINNSFTAVFQKSIMCAIFPFPASSSSSSLFHTAYMLASLCRDGSPR